MGAGRGAGSGTHTLPWLSGPWETNSAEGSAAHVGPRPFPGLPPLGGPPPPLCPLLGPAPPAPPLPHASPSPQASTCASAPRATPAAPVRWRRTLPTAAALSWRQHFWRAPGRCRPRWPPSSGALTVSRLGGHGHSRWRWAPEASPGGRARAGVVAGRLRASSSAQGASVSVPSALRRGPSTSRGSPAPRALPAPARDWPGAGHPRLWSWELCVRTTGRRERGPVVWSRCLWVSGSLRAWLSHLAPEQGVVGRLGDVYCGPLGGGGGRGPRKRPSCQSLHVTHSGRSSVLKAILHPLPVPPGLPNPLRATSHPSPTAAPGLATPGLPSTPPQAARTRGPWSEVFQALSPAGPCWLCSRTQLSSRSHQGCHLRMGQGAGHVRGGPMTTPCAAGLVAELSGGQAGVGTRPLGGMGIWTGCFLPQPPPRGLHVSARAVPGSPARGPGWGGCGHWSRGYKPDIPMASEQS